MLRWLCVAVVSALGALIAQAPLGPPPVPPQNPWTQPKALLGKVLFWDEQLASNGRMACGTCHRLASGGGDPRRVRHPGSDGIPNTTDDTFGSPGIERRSAQGAFEVDARFGTGPQVTPRAAPGILHAAWSPELFWDGRVGGAFVDPVTRQTVIPHGGALEAQALHPFVDPVEMSRPGRTWTELRLRLQAIRPLALATDLPADVRAALAGGVGYPELFRRAFGTPAIDPTRIAFALASYLRTLVADQTPWDRHQRGVPNALTPDQLAGLGWFTNEARCHICHPLGEFTDHQYRGLGLVPVTQDPGRGAITNRSEDLGLFKVPSLRQAALKSTFMHNGRFTTMTQVVGFYRNGGGTAGPRDPELTHLSLDAVRTQQLLAFLEQALVDPRVRNELPPFDRPRLWSERNPLGANLHGVPTPWGGGTPQLLADSVPFLGNDEWAVGVSGAPAGSRVLLALGLARALPGAVIAGMPLAVSLAQPHAVLDVPIDGQGVGTLRLPVPVLPGLGGLVVEAQAFLPLAGGAFAATSGASFAVQ